MRGTIQLSEWQWSWDLGPCPVFAILVGHNTGIAGIQVVYTCLSVLPRSTTLYSYNIVRVLWVHLVRCDYLCIYYIERATRYCSVELASTATMYIVRGTSYNIVVLLCTSIQGSQLYYVLVRTGPRMNIIVARCTSTIVELAPVLELLQVCTADHGVSI